MLHIKEFSPFWPCFGIYSRKKMQKQTTICKTGKEIGAKIKAESSKSLLKNKRRKQENKKRRRKSLLQASGLVEDSSHPQDSFRVNKLLLNRLRFFFICKFFANSVHRPQNNIFLLFFLMFLFIFLHFSL